VKDATPVPGPGAAPDDAAIERTVRQLELQVTRRLDGLLHGDHLGLVPGSGSEKAESREYRVGDDVRRMDWAVTARTTVPHVHDLIVDRELETWVLVDLTASMEFGTVTCEKRDLAIAMTAAVGFLTARTGNRLGALLLTSRGVQMIPARSGRHHLRTLLRTMVAAPRDAYVRPARRPRPPGTDLAAAIERLRQPPRRRGLVVVISDFLPAAGSSDTPGWERALRGIASRHQALAVEILDPRELEMPNVGVLAVVDPETGALLEVSTRSTKLRERYAAAAAEQRAASAAALRRAGAGHLVLRTDRDWMVDIVRYVSATRRRRLLAARSPGPSAVAPR
jgi:uncharacterized protein (DUF58 family)